MPAGVGEEEEGGGETSLRLPLSLETHGLSLRFGENVAYRRQLVNHKLLTVYKMARNEYDMLFKLLLIGKFNEANFFLLGTLSLHFVNAITISQFSLKNAILRGLTYYVFFESFCKLVRGHLFLGLRRGRLALAPELLIGPAFL